MHSAFAHIGQVGEVRRKLAGREDHLYRALDFEFKIVGTGDQDTTASDTADLIGMGSVAHNIDSYGEIVHPEAFDADMSHFMTKGFIGGLNHDWDNPIGRPIEGTKATPQGLLIHAKLLNTAHAKDVKEMMRGGVVKSLSIGYKELGHTDLDNADDVMDYWAEQGYTPSAEDMARAQGGARLLTRVKTYEVSPVTVPANDLADIHRVKRRIWAPGFATNDERRTTKDDAGADDKGATGAVGLPLAPRDHPWDAGAAEKRVKTWADAEEKPNAKYRSAHLWYDSAKAGEFGSYKLPFADVIDGSLHAVPRAVFAVAARLDQTDIPAADKAAVKTRVARLYARINKQGGDPVTPPWEKPADGGKSLPATEREFEQLLRDAGFSHERAVAITNHGFKAALRDVGETADPDPAPASSAEPETETQTALEPDDASPLVLALRQRVMTQNYERFLAISGGHTR